jgi:hypothetical protein
MNIEKSYKLAFIGGGINSAVGYAHFCAAQLDGKWQLVAGAFSQDRDINTQSAMRYSVAAERTYHCWK